MRSLTSLVGGKLRLCHRAIRRGIQWRRVTVCMQLARQSLGNLAQAVICSTQNPFELLLLTFDNIGPYAFTLVTV